MLSATVSRPGRRAFVLAVLLATAGMALPARAQSVSCRGQLGTGWVLSATNLGVAEAKTNDGNQQTVFFRDAGGLVVSGGATCRRSPGWAARLELGLMPMAERTTLVCSICSECSVCDSPHGRTTVDFDLNTFVALDFIRTVERVEVGLGPLVRWVYGSPSVVCAGTGSWGCPDLTFSSTRTHLGLHSSAHLIGIPLTLTDFVTVYTHYDQDPRKSGYADSATTHRFQHALALMGTLTF